MEATEAVTTTPRGWEEDWWRENGERARRRMAVGGGRKAEEVEMGEERLDEKVEQMWTPTGQEKELPCLGGRTL